jgi:hypothetical protein
VSIGYIQRLRLGEVATEAFRRPWLTEDEYS